MMFVPSGNDQVYYLRERTSISIEDIANLTIPQKEKEKTMLTTTTTEQEFFNLDSSDDIELDLDSILAIECDRGLPSDMDGGI